MNWKEACLDSPDNEAFREIVEGQWMYVSPVDNTGCSVYQNREPYYKLYDDVDVDPNLYDDWEPVGFGRKELDARKTDMASTHYRSGYLSPEGDFYGCKFQGHNQLAKAILFHLFQKKEVLVYDAHYHLFDKEKWGVLHESGGHPDPRQPALTMYPPGTKKQRHQVKLWCKHHGLDSQHYLYPER